MFRAGFTTRLCAVSTKSTPLLKRSEEGISHLSHSDSLTAATKETEDLQRTAAQSRFVQQLNFKKKEHRALKRMAQGLGLLHSPKDQALARQMEEAFVPMDVLEKRREKRELFQQKVEDMMATPNSSTQSQFGKGYRKKKLITPEMLGAEIGQSGMDDPRLNGGGKGSWNDFKSKNSKSVPLVHPKLAPGFYSQEFDCWYNFSEEDVRESSCRGQGPGGQATNRRMQTCVLFHLPSRIQVKFHKHRSLHDNRKAARRVLNFKVENWLMGDESREAEVLKQWAEEKKLEEAREAERLRLLDEHEKMQWWKFRDFLEGKGVIAPTAINREGGGVMDCLEETHYEQLQMSISEGPKVELSCKDFLNQLSPASWWRMLSSGKSASAVKERTSFNSTTENVSSTSALMASFSSGSPLAFTPVWFSYLFPCSKRPADASCCPDGLIQMLKTRFDAKKPVNTPVTEVNSSAISGSDEGSQIREDPSTETGTIPVLSSADDDWRRRHIADMLRELDQTTSVSIESEIARCRGSPVAQDAVRRFFPLFLEMFGIRLRTKMVERDSNAKPLKRESGVVDLPKRKRKIIKRVIVRRKSSPGPSSSSTKADHHEESQKVEPLKSILCIELDGLLWLEQRGRLMAKSANRGISSSALVEHSLEPDSLAVGLFAHVLCCLDDMGLDAEYEALRTFLYENSSLVEKSKLDSNEGVSSQHSPENTSSILPDARVPGGIRLPPWPRDFSDCVHMTLLAEERSGLTPDDQL